MPTKKLGTQKTNNKKTNKNQNTSGELQKWLSMGYPLAKHFIKPKQLISKLREYKPKISYQRFNYLYAKELPELKDHRFKGKYISIEIPMNDYNNLDVIVDYYTEESRLKCALKDKKSAHELATKGDLLSYTLQSLVKKQGAGKITFETYRDEIYNYPGIYICSGESVVFYKGLVQVLFNTSSNISSLSGLNIMDGAIGYGQRLMLAILLRANYIGIDPNTETIAGCEKMVAELGIPHKQHPYAEGLPESDAITRAPNNSQDLIFFSPPSFDEEIYGDHEGQSILSFRTFQTWLDGFLYPSLDILVSKLKPRGYFVIQSRRIKFIYKYLLTKQDIRFIGVIARKTYGNKYKPNHIFQKIR
jgi:hypothetical protein